MANGIYCETLLRVRPLSAGSFWHALTFEREGDGQKPKTFLCRADLGRQLEVGDVYLFGAKGRCILRIANDVPVGQLPLEYFRLWLSFTRKPYPPLCQTIADALSDGQSSESLAEFVEDGSVRLRACLPRFQYHWRNVE